MEINLHTQQQIKLDRSDHRSLMRFKISVRPSTQEKGTYVAAVVEEPLSEFGPHADRPASNANLQARSTHGLNAR